VTNLTDNSGNVQDTIAYDAFGNVTSESNPSFGDRFKYTGRELDSETGFQYNRARYYDAAIGRWTSQDPLSFDAGDANLYRYVGNSPTNATDPFGLATRFGPLDGSGESGGGSGSGATGSAPAQGSPPPHDSNLLGLGSDGSRKPPSDHAALPVGAPAACAGTGCAAGFQSKTNRVYRRRTQSRSTSMGDR
jgi:RHS repeat-associated protein